MTSKNRKFETKNMILIALFTALMAITAIISIPLPFSPVPITLVTLTVLLAGSLLGPRFATAASGLYLALGAIGLPVFHNMTGGMGILAGPTGGFLVGYLLIALTFGWLSRVKPPVKEWTPKVETAWLALAALVASFICYIPGILWYVHLYQVPASAAIASCVLPFIPGDLAKSIAAAVLTRRLEHYRLKG